MPILSAAVLITVTSVYDGDTLKGNIEGWPDIVGHNMPVRVAGIDTPELRGKCEAEKLLAKQARSVARNLLLNATRVELTNIQRGKYFRLVADVTADGVDLGRILLAAELARPYDGGAKQGWCE